MKSFDHYTEFIMSNTQEHTAPETTSSKAAVSRENRMGTEPVGRLLISMALPLMASMLVQALYNVVDSIFVARISEDALTAVSMAFPIQTIIIAVMGGTGVGMNAILSKSLGEKNQANVNKAANAGVLLSLLSYIVFAIIGLTVARPFYMSQISYNMDIVNYGVDYLSVVCLFSFGITAQFVFERMLQATGRTFYTMITQMTGAVLNIILDPMFIFGIGPFPELGVKGAAIATVIGQITSGTLALIMNLRKNPDVQLRFKEIFHPDLSIISRIYKIGIPSIIMQCIGSVMYYGMNLILTGFSSTASAVFGVYFKLQSFFFMPIFGMNNALVPIIAYNYGAGKRSRLLGSLKKALVIAFCIMVCATLTFECIPHILLKMFSASDNMIEIGTHALRIIAVHFPVAAFCIVLGTVFQALGKAIYSAINSVARQLVALLPAAYILARFGGLDAVWFSFLVAEVMSLTLTMVFFRKLYKDIILKIPDQK